MAVTRTIKVFIASPGDLAVERRVFKEVVDELNNGFGRGADVTYQPLGWEDALSQVGRRPQSVINRDIDACDVFILAMWRRWGQEAPDAHPYTSYTEEEFYRALTRYEKDASPQIFVFFKHIDPGQMADPGPQLEKVLAFRRKLEQTRNVMYRPFDSEAAFRKEMDRHLVAFAKGETPCSEDDCTAPLVPDSILVEMEQLREEARLAVEEAEQARERAQSAEARAEAAEKLADARSAKEAVALAESAATAALEGRIEEAQQGFAKALDGTTNLRVLHLAIDFFKRIGELDEAERLIRRWLAISGPDAQTANTADAYGNLGKIIRRRGDLEEAERMHRKALEINENLGRLEGMAGDYGNLGRIYRRRGDTDEAERMHRKALEINEKLGRLEGMAIDYGNLGRIFRRRGDLDEAERMHRKALEIDEKLGRFEGMAIDYGNLGIIMQTRADLDEAERMHRMSLAINEKLGRLEGMAANYTSLGLIVQTRGDLDEAERMYRKSLEINEKLGRLEGMASDYGNLGFIKQERGEFDAAEPLHRKAMEIDEGLGRREGMAGHYGNLGNIAKQRGDIPQARQFWTISRDLYAKIGMKPELEKVQGWLDSLPPEP